MVRPLLVVWLLSASLPSWAAVPVSGRTQQLAFSRAAVQAAAATAYHDKTARLAANHQLDADPHSVARVRRVAARLIAQALELKPEATGWRWEVHVTDEPDVAAYSMAGGKLMVGSAFLDKYQLTDDELAVALAHEIGHVIAEHVREQLSVAAGFSHARNRKVKVDEVIDAMNSDIAVYLRLQPLSRLQEMEADDIGIELAARAGIAPEHIKSFYDKITTSDGGQSIFDTHGSSSRRAAFVRSMAEYAGIEQETMGSGPLPVYVFR